MLTEAPPIRRRDRDLNADAESCILVSSFSAYIIESALAAVYFKATAKDAKFPVVALGAGTCLPFSACAEVASTANKDSVIAMVSHLGAIFKLRKAFARLQPRSKGYGMRHAAVTASTLPGYGVVSNENATVLKLSSARVL